MTTVRKLSKSVPSRLSMVLGRPYRNVYVVVLPRLPFAHIRRPFTRLSFRRFAYCYAPSLPSHTTGYSLSSAALRSLG